MLVVLVDRRTAWHENVLFHTCGATLFPDMFSAILAKNLGGFSVMAGS
jgi:hypothetical protein